MHLEPTPDGVLADLPGGHHGRQRPGGGSVHFPDSNATLTRLLVRSLIPTAVPGTTQEDVGTARVDYGVLDRADQTVQVRLNSTVVNVRHRGAGSARDIEVSYVRRGQTHQVLGGAAPDYAYYVGCSKGGQQGMMETQRYPEDFDDLVIGDPAHAWTQFYAGAHLWYSLATLTDPECYIPPDKASILGNAVTAACDALDGVEDGVGTVRDHGAAGADGADGGGGHTRAGLTAGAGPGALSGARRCAGHRWSDHESQAGWPRLPE